MKVILIGNAQTHPEVVGLLNEDMLLNPAVANQTLNFHKMKIERIETAANGEKVVYIKENDESTKLLNG